MWGDFEGGRNVTLGSGFIKLQKKMVGMIGGKRGWFHADPLFAKFKILKIQDLYKHQLRIHASGMENCQGTRLQCFRGSQRSMGMQLGQQ